jgi:hypothetical protein
MRQDSVNECEPVVTTIVQAFSETFAPFAVRTLKLLTAKLAKDSRKVRKAIGNTVRDCTSTRNLDSSLAIA